jgi:hypothetical protein
MAAARGRRAAGPPLPATVLASAVILLVVAVLVGIVAGIIVLSASLLTTFSDPSMFGPGFEDTLTSEQLEAGMNLASGFLIAFAIVALLVAGAHLVGGIGVLRRRSWGRITGLVLSFLALIILTIGLVSTVTTFGQVITLPGDVGMTQEQLEQMATSGSIVGLVMTGVFFAAYAFVAVILLRRGDVFSD